MNKLFQPVSDLLIGQVVEVAGTTLKVELARAVLELTRSYEGRVYPVGQIGSIVKIHFGRRIVFGFVTLLRMRSLDLEAGDAPIPPEADQQIMEVDLFAEGAWNQGKGQLRYHRGVTTYPLPHQGVYLLTQEEAAMLYSAAEGQRTDNGSDPLVPFATYVGADSTPCRANVDKMFGMHCAIVGSTGSGKSGAVAAVLHAVLDHKKGSAEPCCPKVVMIDPHGEYSAAFSERGIVYRAYDPIGHESTSKEGDVTSEKIRLPYWLMNAEEFRQLIIGKTEHEATSQHNVIYKALSHARMVTQELVRNAPIDYASQSAPQDGSELDDPLSRRMQGIKDEDISSFDSDKPIPFSLEEFINHIKFLQCAQVKDKAVKAIPQSSSQSFKSVLDKLRVLQSDPRIRFLMEDSSGTEPHPTLHHILEQFVGQPSDGKQHLRIIDISGLPNEVAGPLTAMVARLLFQYKLYQTQDERREDPVLLVCEEAHRYVPDRGEAQYAAAQGAIRRIAREGRKYGLGLMLVSQRPSDIESTVISQCGTWIVLRLTNSADQAHVARFLPDGLSGMTRALPALSQQEALFVGEGAALPARIRINDLPKDRQPKSNTVSFISGWTGPELDSDRIEKIAQRMASAHVSQKPVSPAPTPAADND